MVDVKLRSAPADHEDVEHLAGHPPQRPGAVPRVQGREVEGREFPRHGVQASGAQASGVQASGVQASGVQASGVAASGVAGGGGRGEKPFEPFARSAADSRLDERVAQEAADGGAQHGTAQHAYQEVPVDALHRGRKQGNRSSLSH